VCLIANNPRVYWVFKDRLSNLSESWSDCERVARCAGEPRSGAGRPAWMQAAETGDMDVDCRGQPRRKTAGEPSHI